MTLLQTHSKGYKTQVITSSMRSIYMTMFLLHHKWEKIFFFPFSLTKFFCSRQFLPLSSSLGTNFFFLLCLLIFDLSFSFASKSFHTFMFIFLHFLTFKSHFSSSMDHCGWLGLVYMDLRTIGDSKLQCILEKPSLHA